MIHPAHEVDEVIDVSLFGQPHHAVHFGFAGAAATHDHHADFLFASLHLCGGFHQQVEALQRFHAPDVKQDFFPRSVPVAAGTSFWSRGRNLARSTPQGASMTRSGSAS